jgi:hypothetical protein
MTFVKKDELKINRELIFASSFQKTSFLQQETFI